MSNDRLEDGGQQILRFGQDDGEGNAQDDMESHEREEAQADGLALAEAQAEDQEERETSGRVGIRSHLRGSVTLKTGGDGRLLAIVDDEVIGVRVRQCFPWSEPHRHLSLRDDDESEVAFVDDPASLESESRRALEHALAVAGFVLEVTRVVDIDEEVEIRQWTVETVHGTRSFQTHLDDWPRVLPGGALLIRDVAGDLYRLPEPRKLDKKSRELLWAFVD